jgi:hypothetical protein
MRALPSITTVETMPKVQVVAVQGFGRFGPLGVQTGVRAEHADTRLTVPGGESFGKSYSSIFPNANLRLDVGGGRELRNRR